ncbi:GntR family transcriptional regulator [Micromonospora taraxaci]|uniref:GntR family transcriptional regulator n=1 Tax=Micromonospora taraxaci TaxID=1316803 RepID=UPI0033AA810C
MIDFGAERAVYRQIADVLRAQIREGRYRPGDLLPYEGRLGQEYGVGRPTVRRALALLRLEGLVITERGYGTYVVESQPRVTVRVPRAARLWSRMPTDEERVKLGIDPGAVVPVVEFQVGAQPIRGPWRADRTDFTTA